MFVGEGKCPRKQVTGKGNAKRKRIWYRWENDKTREKQLPVREGVEYSSCVNDRGLPMRRDCQMGRMGEEQRIMEKKRKEGKESHGEMVVREKMPSGRRQEEDGGGIRDGGGGMGEGGVSA